MSEANHPTPEKRLRRLWCRLVGHDKAFEEPNGLDWTWSCRRCGQQWWQCNG